MVYHVNGSLSKHEQLCIVLLKDQRGGAFSAQPQYLNVVTAGALVNLALSYVTVMSYHSVPRDSQKHVNYEGKLKTSLKTKILDLKSDFHLTGIQNLECVGHQLSSCVLTDVPE